MRSVWEEAFWDHLHQGHFSGTSPWKTQGCLTQVWQHCTIALITEDTQMAKNHRKRCLTLLIIREMQIKTTMRYRLSLVRMAIIKKPMHNKYWRGCGTYRGHLVSRRDAQAIALIQGWERLLCCCPTKVIKVSSQNGFKWISASKSTPVNFLLWNVNQCSHYGKQYEGFLKT